MLTDFISPAFTLAVGVALWRLIHAELNELRRDLSGRIDRINDRLDRHLDGHP